MCIRDRLRTRCRRPSLCACFCFCSKRVALSVRKQAKSAQTETLASCGRAQGQARTFCCFLKETVWRLLLACALGLLTGCSKPAKLSCRSSSASMQVATGCTVDRCFRSLSEQVVDKLSLGKGFPACSQTQTERPPLHSSFVLCSEANLS